MPDSVTLKDIARLAGVSTATVARVIHNNGYVSEDVRTRVSKVIERTGYRINVLAQGLSKRRTLTIGHLLDSLVPNPFFASVALGVEREASSRGYGVLMFDMRGDPEQERRGVETLIQRQVDAMIFTVAHDAANVARALDAGLPVVQVERVTSSNSHQVLVDNWQGSFEATEHLISHGHRRIAYVGRRLPPAGELRDVRNVEVQRFKGYLDALGHHHIPVDGQLIILDDYYIRDLNDGNFGVGVNSVGYRHMQQLLQLDERPTAVFAASDLLAAGALQAINEAGLHVPRDISVVGFDNTIAPFLSPPLTTVALPLLDIGRAAAQIAVGQIERLGEAGEIEIRQLTTTLILRRSTGKVAVKTAR